MLWDITNHGDRLRSHRQSHGQTKKNSMNTLVRSAQHAMAFISNCSFNLDRETLICVLLKRKTDCMVRRCVFSLQRRGIS